MYDCCDAALSSVAKMRETGATAQSLRRLHPSNPPAVLYCAVLQQPSTESARSGTNVPTDVAPTENRLGAKLAG